MITKYEYQGVTWVDVENPTDDEVEEIAETFGLGLLLPQELLSPTLKPRADLYPNFAYTVLHFPALRHTHGLETTQEVDIIMGKDFIVTVHYHTIPAIYDLQRSFEAAMLLKHRVGGTFHTGHILLELAERLYQGVENELESLEDSIAAIDEQIFIGHEKEMVYDISTVSRELLGQKRALMAHKEVLESLEQIGVSLFGEAFGNYFRAVSSFHYRVYNHALALHDTVNELRDTNDSLLSTRQNEVMKILTIMAFTTFPLTLISSIFGMNTHYLPIVGMPGDFWIVIGIMAFLMLSFFTFFKYKRWF
jgi:magnesium transporter